MSDSGPYTESSGVEQRLAAMLDRLREHGRRITPQRIAILRLLAASDGHPSVDQLHRKVLLEFPTTSLATVYKTINLLKEEGEVLELEFSERANRFDGKKPYPHPHVICRACGRIVDPETIDLAAITNRIAEETGFSIQTHRLDFYGICPECKQHRK